MKKLTYLMVLFLVASFAFAAGNKKTLTPSVDGRVATVTATFASSYVDTVKWIASAGVSAAAFAAEWQDSVSVTSVTFVRVVDGTAMAAAAADTLSSFYAFTGTPTGAAPVRAVTQAFTLAPLADEYWFYVTYASSANGVGTPTVKYKVILQRSFEP